MDQHSAIRTPSQRDPDRAVDGQREDEAVVVVGVFADQVDPAWGPHYPTWGFAEFVLKGIGDWMQVNSEAIYGTTNRISFGEGPNQIKKAGAFNEKDVPAFNSKDVRFTVNGNALYATVLGWPGETTTIETLNCLYPDEIKSVRMLGVDKELEWRLTPEGLTIQTPAHKPCDHAYVFKIVRGQPYP